MNSQTRRDDDAVADAEARSGEAASETFFRAVLRLAEGSHALSFHHVVWR